MTCTSSVPERLSGLQRVLNPFQRLRFTAEAEKRLALQIEHVLFADRRLMRQRSTRQHRRQGSSDHGVVVADPSGAQSQVDAELQRSEEPFAADGDRLGSGFR